jgi:hypothetical protein
VPFTVGTAPQRRQAGAGVTVVGVPHEPPLPGRERAVGGFGGGERAQIFDALDRDHAGARGGRVGGRGVGVPGLLWAIVAVGFRALARCATARRGPVGEATAVALRGVRDDACALVLVVGSAPARRGVGERRGAASGRRRAWASPDRAARRTAPGHGTRLAACRPGTRGEPAGARDPAVGLAGPRTRRGHPGRQRPGRCGRGDHARGRRVGAAVWPPPRPCRATPSPRPASRRAWPSSW